jgi:hypothetical protein
MTKETDRIVSKRSDGTWENKKITADRAASVHDK